MAGQGGAELGSARQGTRMSFPGSPKNPEWRYLMINIRLLVYSIYPGQAWKKKIDVMSDSQVQAIYLNFKRKGVLK
jgi:hypothetical protein